MKKKLVSVFIACVAALSVAACGSVDKENPGKSATADTSRQESGQDAAQQDEKGASQQDESDASSDDSESVKNTDSDESVSTQAQEPSSSEQDPADMQVISEEDAEKLLTDLLGTEDKETGNTYSFGYIDTFTIDGAEYYGYVWSWLVDGDHSSRLTDLLVKTDGSAVYEGEYDGENWTTDYKNMLEQ